MNSTEKMVLELHAAGKSIPDIAARIGKNRVHGVYVPESAWAEPV